MTFSASAEKYLSRFWGRKWRIVIVLEDGSVLNDDGTTTATGLDVSNLRVVGTIEDNIVSSYNPCELTIFNLNRDTEKLILAQGKEIYVELGYESPELYGSIYHGKIYQTHRSKANVTDYTLTLKALGSFDILSEGVVSLSAKRGTNYRELLDIVAQSSTPSLEIDEVPEGWGEDRTFSRGVSLAGRTKNILDEIATSTNSIIRIDDGKINVIQLAQEPTEAIELNYNTGLVGQPVQDRNGVNFQTLINPQIKLNSWVHINNALINEASLEYGEMAIQPLDIDGLYRVISRQFQFDTRGNEWYINCKSITQTGGTPDMLVENATEGI